MITIDYTYYTDIYKGFAVPSEKFDFYIERALDYLDEATPNATDDDREDTDVIDTYKKCACEVCDTLYIADDVGNISSEKNGSYSVSYKNSKKSTENSAYSIITRRLGRTGLMYGGVDSAQ